ncbi:MAG: LytR/AlgR family response regulator transcription factor, partial [Bacteroidales bacterium]
TNPEPDLIFLDIHLEDDLSFAIFDKVEVKSPIIFTTAFDEYAIKAFKLKSIDYLLKPISQDDLNKAILKYQDWNKVNSPLVDMQSLFEIINKKVPTYKNRFSITIGTKIKSFDISEIAYFYSQSSITFMVTNDNMEYPLDYSLDYLISLIDPMQFFRINRQYLVKMKSIANVHVFPKSHLKIDLIPARKEEVYVSIDKVTKFKDWLNS